MKKATKIVMILVIIMQIVLITSTVLGVSNPKNYTGDTNYTGASGLETIGNQLITIISTIGSVVSVIVLVVLGIKYMMGSAEEKAEYKKTLMPYVIGAAFVFAASSIAGIVFSFSQNLGNTGV